ncbi:MAG TPA: hypothetical protein VE777_14230 [Gaiellales bacterium]|jgi:hypothetical protein|nr:hypothetical protein [Gaiellales bacterium]
MAASRPQGLVLKHDRDLEGRGYQIWVRRALMLVPVTIVVLALAGVFGQRPDTSDASSADASLSVYAPAHLRGGLLWEARFHIHARADLRDAKLVLGSGWLEGMSVNTIEPSPSSETSRNGSLELDLGHIPAGGSYLLFLQFQVLATNVGRRSADVSLWDGDRRLLQIDRTVTVFP